MANAGAVLLTPPEQRWECPNCTFTDVTHHRLAPGEAAQRFHRCRGMALMNVPMVPAGMAKKVKVWSEERGDYVGQDHVQLDANGRPIMAVHVTRDDGEDTAVYAPTAAARKD